MLSKLDELEAESIFFLREAAAEFARPVMLYSVGKDSSVLLRLAQKAYWPGRIPFPLLHVDTGFKFPEMIGFRDETAKKLGLQLIVWRNEKALLSRTNPWSDGIQKCCGLLKTQALLDAMRAHGFDCAIGGARREEEKSRAKERIFSFRDVEGRWNPEQQRPEFWNLFNTKKNPGESMRVFPLSNWTELDVWRYIEREQIPVVSLYFAQERAMQVKGAQLLPISPLSSASQIGAAEACRFRTIGCWPCTGAIHSNAKTVSEIIQELECAQNSERENRIIDHDREGSMEMKKREGYF